jgi:hypothetical protein
MTTRAIWAEALCDEGGCEDEHGKAKLRHPGML